MATQAQIEANRANAVKSTGPRTAEGKAAVAQNAVKHGLLAEQVVIAGEDPGEFEFHRQALMAEISPVGDYEKILAERAAELVWKLLAGRTDGGRGDRDAAGQGDFEHAYRETDAQVLPRNVQEGMVDPAQGQTSLGRAIVRDYANDRVLDRLGLYERRIERSLYKTMDELERRRLMREALALEAEKSEARSAKSETNTNDRNEEAVAASRPRALAMTKVEKRVG